MLIMTTKGLYCPAGQFYIDPSRAVEHAVITHAYSDHARKGCQMYYGVASGDYKREKDPTCDVLVTEATFGTPSFIAPQSFMKSEHVELLGKKYLTAFASGWTAQRVGIAAFPDSDLFPENPDQLSLF
jgi:Cft2 family RNA processing exonuclease